jgi:hypothetical protein
MAIVKQYYGESWAGRECVLTAISPVRKSSLSLRSHFLFFLLASGLATSAACGQQSKAAVSKRTASADCSGCNSQFNILKGGQGAFHEEDELSRLHFAGFDRAPVRSESTRVPYTGPERAVRRGFIDFEIGHDSDLFLRSQKQSQETRQNSGNGASATGGSPGHIFWVVPAFKVDYAGKFQPLTPKEKFQEWAQGSYDPLGLGVGAFEAGVLEYSSTDGFCGYGKDYIGYMECFGSAELDSNISSFIGDYVLTVAFHQDPRYFRLGKGPFARRVFYAISRVFVTYNDRGHTVFYSSALIGTVAAAGISNLYYPPQDRGFGLTLSRIGFDLGNTALYNAAAEFWPDINSGLHRVF